MSDNESGEIWDRKYQEGLPSLAKPDPFFISAFEQFVLPSFPGGGEALELATGLGRHALWLAKRAWKVEEIDISKVAIEKLRQDAQRAHLNINAFAADAAEYTFEPDRFWTGASSPKWLPP